MKQSTVVAELLDHSVSVIIPVFNEVTTIEYVVEKVLAESVTSEVIIVDDASTDGTSSVLEALSMSDSRIQLVHQKRNCGKGAAIRRGMELVRSSLVVIQDADMEYDPQEIPKMVQPIVDGEADVVFGTRCNNGSFSGCKPIQAAANRMLTYLTNTTLGLCLSDMETGFKAFPASICKSLDLRENRFGIEPELTAKFAKLGLRIKEVPVTYSGRSYADGKKIGWRDGLWAILCIARYSLTRRA